MGVTGIALEDMPGLGRPAKREELEERIDRAVEELDATSQNSIAGVRSATSASAPLAPTHLSALGPVIESLVRSESGRA